MKKFLLPLVLGALAFPIFGCGNAALPSQGSAHSYRHISQAEARKMMEAETGYILLDVRTRKEYDEGHIPGAICVPNEAIQETPPAELPDKNQLILVYCRSGRRSKEAAQKLADMGYTNIIDFGGITGWQGELARTTAGDTVMETSNGKYTEESRIEDVASDTAFAGYGRLLFPIQKDYMQGDALGNLGLTWYTNIRPEETLEVLNYLRSGAGNGLSRHLHGGGKGSRPGEKGHGALPLQREAQREMRHPLRWRRLPVRRGHPRQLPPSAGTVQERLQRLCPDLPSRRKLQSARPCASGCIYP